MHGGMQKYNSVCRFEVCLDSSAYEWVYGLVEVCPLVCRGATNSNQGQVMMYL